MTESQPLAAELAALVDTLLPGDDRFPAAGAIGLHGMFADRFRRLLGPDGLEKLVAALAAAGGPIAAQPPSARPAILQKLATDRPELFQAARMVAYLSYYENPDVIAAVRSLGRRYNASPQPAGYPMAAFDADDPRQAPTHRRGRYVATNQVRRVDLSTLPEDPLAPEDWRAAGDPS